MSLIQINTNGLLCSCCNPPSNIHHYSCPIELHGTSSDSESKQQQPFDELFANGFSELESELKLLNQKAGNNNKLEQKVEQPQNVINGIKCEKDKYQIMLNLQQFKPEEIHINTFDDHCIVVEGIHKEKPTQNAYAIETFKRRYLLPDQIKPENIYCLLTSNGVLKVEIARPLSVNVSTGGEIDLGIKTEQRSIQLVQNPKNNGGKSSLLRALLTNHCTKVLKQTRKSKLPKCNWKPLKNVKWCEDVRG